jgi:hypothetical protein
MGDLFGITSTRFGRQWQVYGGPEASTNQGRNVSSSLSRNNKGEVVPSLRVDQV